MGANLANARAAPQERQGYLLDLGIEWVLGIELSGRVIFVVQSDEINPGIGHLQTIYRFAATSGNDYILIPQGANPGLEPPGDHSHQLLREVSTGGIEPIRPFGCDLLGSIPFLGHKRTTLGPSRNDIEALVDEGLGGVAAGEDDDFVRSLLTDVVGDDFGSPFLVGDSEKPGGGTYHLRDLLL